MKIADPNPAAVASRALIEFRQNRLGPRGTRRSLFDAFGEHTIEAVFTDGLIPHWQV
jgi:hypothetical protein